MNALERAKLQQALALAIAAALDSDEVRGEVVMPLLGEATIIHMADAVVNILEALQDAENYIGDQLSQEEREAIGI